MSALAILCAVTGGSGPAIVQELHKVLIMHDGGDGALLVLLIFAAKYPDLLNPPA